MESIPKTSTVFSALLRADFTTQWRNRRSFVLLLLVPVIILFSWQNYIDKVGAPFVLSTAITIGLVASGLMGYTNSIARDRDKGIFQRLRVSPMPTWCIMASRLAVQVAMIIILTLIVFIAGKNMHNIILSPSGYILSFLASILGGAVYLGIGQIIVGLVQNPETVNSTSRLVYFAFIILGMFADMGTMGDEVQKMVLWSPWGTVKRIVSTSMTPDKWNTDTTIALAVTIGYAVLFSVIGIKKFKWTNK